MTLPWLPVEETPQWTQVQQRLILLDTGQLEPSMIWQSDRGYWLLGTGVQFGQQHTMSMAVLPALTHLGIHHLEGVLLWNNNEDSQQGLRLLTQQISVKDIQIHETCQATAQWQWQKQDSDCWLTLPIPTATLWISPNPPQFYPQKPLPQDIIISPLPTRRGSSKTTVKLWLSQTQTIPTSLAVESYNTQQQGAIYLSLQQKTHKLSFERQSKGRFYQNR
jgi:beta-lactamase superfamily II metal-dependent hydrolase